MRYYLMIFLFLSFGFAVNAAELITIEGRLLSEADQPIVGAEVLAGNKTAITDN